MRNKKRRETTTKELLLSVTRSKTKITTTTGKRTRQRKHDTQFSIKTITNLLRRHKNNTKE